MVREISFYLRRFRTWEEKYGFLKYQNGMGKFWAEGGRGEGGGVRGGDRKETNGPIHYMKERSEGEK